MKKEIFDILLLFVQIGLIIIGTWVLPSVKKWIVTNINEKQRLELMYWAEKGIKFAENIYKERGQGFLKKEFVIDWLEKNNIKATPEQTDIVIETIVSYFNKNGWNKDLEENKGA